MAKAVDFASPPGMPPTSNYSHVATVQNGRTIYLSGQVPLNEHGEIVGSTFAEQATQVFENIGKALAGVGAEFSDIVKISMFVTDMSCLQELRLVRDRYLHAKSPPASTLLEVSGFFCRDIMIEIEEVAVTNLEFV